MSAIPAVAAEQPSAPRGRRHGREGRADHPCPPALLRWPASAWTNPSKRGCIELKRMSPSPAVGAKQPPGPRGCRRDRESRVDYSLFRSHCAIARISTRGTVPLSGAARFDRMDPPPARRFEPHLAAAGPGQHPPASTESTSRASASGARPPVKLCIEHTHQARADVRPSALTLRQKEQINLRPSAPSICVEHPTIRIAMTTHHYPPRSSRINAQLSLVTVPALRSRPSSPSFQPVPIP